MGVVAQLTNGHLALSLLAGWWFGKSPPQRRGC